MTTHTSTASRADETDGSSSTTGCSDGYVYYRTEPVGRNFAPEFRPQLTPKQMLQLGVFGGKYMTDCRGEFPASWFARAKLCADASRCRA